MSGRLTGRHESLSELFGQALQCTLLAFADLLFIVRQTDPDASGCTSNDGS